jgi:hypothetical protein
MASYRKAVLREARAAIKVHLPAFTPASFDLDLHRKRDSLFVAEGRSKLFGLHVEFSSKKPGDFTGELVIMDVPPKPQELAYGYHPEFDVATNGIYRIGFFVCGFDRWWQLRDHEEEDSQFFRSLDPSFPEAGRMLRLPHNWRPRDFSIPIEVRIKEAVGDFVAAIRDSVVPKLPLKNA